jgi:hypothetical protein
MTGYDVCGVLMLVLLTLAGCLINTELYENRKAELTDHDGDGFVQELDCDDADATVFPGAAEVCDGALQDCDGEVDEDAVDAPAWYPDADVDGFGAAGAAPVQSCDGPDGYVVNALDCDDGATRVNPTAEEVAYDGVDDDCDGADLDDLDGDGYAAERTGGGDCDDEDAAVYPGATDAPYDGVDQDCVGGDADDLDGDGQAATEAGGGDCDDSDPSILTGAAETWADGFTDNDCDDELEAATLTYGAGAWTGVRPNGQLGRRLGALGDVTGDGRADYLAAAAYDDGAYTFGGAVFLVSGTSGGPLVDAPEMVAGGAYWFLGAGLDGGPDVDADGVPDLFVSATGVDGGAGATWLVSGAAFAASTSPFSAADAALATVSGDTPSSYSGSAITFLGDVMGDGASWYGVSAPLADVGELAGAGKVGLFDAADRGDVVLGDAVVGVEGYFGGATMGNHLTTAGDVDGDGLDDYMVSFGAGDLAVILPGGVASPTLPDDALFRLTGTGVGEIGECMMVGDVDGDGVRDMGCIEGFLTLRLYMELDSAPLRLVTDPSATVNYGVGALGDILVDLGDLDGDGRAETLTPLSWSPTLESAVAVVQPGASFTEGVTLEVLAAPLQAVSSRSGSYGDRAVLVGDVDGDGVNEIALGGFTDSVGGTEAGAVVTIPVPY